MKHLAIDVGRNSVKVVGEEGYRDIFPSYVGEARTLRLRNALRPTDIIVKMGGEAYFMGDLAKDESHDGSRIMTASKVHDDTKMLALAAVARALESEMEEEVAVTTGVPVDFHTSDTKQRLSDLLKGEYELEINGKKRNFSVIDVMVSIEGPTSYTVLCPGKGGTKCFIDAGSRTVNYGKIVGGRYIDRESGTLDFGCDTVPNDESLARLIVSNLSAKWKTFDDETHLLGGGAYKLADRLSKHFSKLSISEDAQFTNAEAFFQVGEKARCKAKASSLSG